MWEVLCVLWCKLVEEYLVLFYVIFFDVILLEMFCSQLCLLFDMVQVSGVGVCKLECYGQVFFDVFIDLLVVFVVLLQDLCYELVSLVCVGMILVQIVCQFNCSEKNVYVMFVEVIVGQQVSLEQVLDLFEEFFGEIQDVFFEEDGELLLVVVLEECFGKWVLSGVLYCVCVVLQVELEL